MLNIGPGVLLILINRFDPSGNRLALSRDAVFNALPILFVFGANE